MTQVEEPLLESAPLAWRLAPQLCHKDPPAGDDCSPMHAAWQYLRALGLVGSPEYRGEFYRSALQSLDGSTGSPKVLICGAADYAMLARVLSAFRERGVEPAITVLDLCETPLALNRWYAERVSCAIETRRLDIMKFTASAPFDAVCTDAFLGRFPPGERPALLTKWRELLRPGGRVVTVNRLRAGSAGKRVQFSGDQVRAFRESVLRAAAARQGELQVDPEELAQRAGLFAANHYTYGVGSADDVREFFGRAGFAMDSQSLAGMTPEVQHALSGPGLSSRSDYLGIIAIRR